MFASRFPNIERRDSGPAHRDATADHDVGYEAAYVPAALTTVQAQGAAQHTPRSAEYETAFEEGVQACDDGASPDASNPYDDCSFPRAMKAGWRDGFASAQATQAPPKAAEQDGPDFYDAATGELLRSYPDDVKGDFDMPGAAKARERFLRDFPAYRMEAAS